MAAKQQIRKTRRNRFKKDSRNQRRRWLGYVMTGLKLSVLMVALLAVSALFMAGYAAVTRSDYFRTQTIKVTGLQHVSEREVLSQAGIHAGDNLLALNLQLVRKRLLAQPWIREARVAREIPGTLTIYVQEHEPLARVDLGRCFLLDVQGRIFKEADPSDPSDLPLVDGIAYGDISLGQDPLTPPLSAVVEALRISRAKQSAVAYADIERLHLDKEVGLTLTLKQNQVIIKLGFDDYQAKYERFRQLRSYLQRDGRWSDFQAVDLNDPDRVVVRLGSPRQGDA